MTSILMRNYFDRIYNVVSRLNFTFHKHFFAKKNEKNVQMNKLQYNYSFLSYLINPFNLYAL